MQALQTAALWLPLLAFCISCAGTAWLAHDLVRAGQLDHPLERSSHIEPTPRGGGLAIMAAVMPFLALLGLDVVIVLALGVLVAASWLDDRRSLSWKARLLLHCFAVGLALASLWQDGDLQRIYPPFAGVPLVFFVAALGLAWLWHINLFNFMDGIDGLASAQAIFIAAGVAFYFFIFTEDVATGLQAVVLAAAMLGFFVWNYPPARIFMGDVGSIPIGFLTGFLLLKLAAVDGFGLALALPLWFWFDATVTLCRRLLRGKPVLSAHRDHFYQGAAGKSKRGHKRVLHLFMALQLFSGAVLGFALAIFPKYQWNLPLIAAGFGALFFTGLARMARNGN